MIVGRGSAPAGGGRVFSQLCGYRCKAAGRAPYAEPSIAKSAGAAHGGVRSTAYDDRHGRIRRGQNTRVFEREELAVDARRFKSDITEAQSRLGISDEILWRFR